MTEIILQQLSIHAYIFSVFALIFRIRQAHIHRGITAWVLRIALASLAIACLHKLFERIEGDPANLTDVWREISLVALLGCRITIRHNHPLPPEDFKYPPKK